MPRADDALKIADALGVSVEYLLTGTERGGAASNPRIQEILTKIIAFDNNDLEAVKSLVNAMAGRYEV
jgi:hypothetical protein